MRFAILGTGGMGAYFGGKLALGKSRLSASLIFLQAMLLLGGLLLFQSQFKDITDIAFIRPNAVMIVLPIALVCVQNELSLPFKQILTVFWRPAIAVSAMSLVLIYVTPQDMGMPAALWLAARVTAGVAVYAGVMLAAWLLSGKPEGAERGFLGLLGLKRGKNPGHLMPPANFMRAGGPSIRLTGSPCMGNGEAAAAVKKTIDMERLRI